MKKKDRIGEVYKNKFDEVFKIIEYKNATDLMVEFQDKHKATVHTQFYNVKMGTVKNPYCPSTYNFGYIGVGKHLPTVDRKATYKYEVWRDMIRRAYSEAFHKKHPYYI